jgi:hypothetical protein
LGGGGSGVGCEEDSKISKERERGGHLATGLGLRGERVSFASESSNSESPVPGHLDSEPCHLLTVHWGIGATSGVLQGRESRGIDKRRCCSNRLIFNRRGKGPNRIYSRRVVSSRKKSAKSWMPNPTCLFRK